MATLENKNSHSLVSGTSSDDSIRNWGDYATLETGAGKLAASC